MIVSVYNIHRNPNVWDQPDDFLPERFDLSAPVPNEQNTDYRQGPLMYSLPTSHPCSYI